MFGYILCSFRDSCPGFISFRQNTPCVGSRRGTAQGAALLTKWEETAIIKAERAPLLAVGSTRFAQIDYADRLAPPRRSVCFYRTERAPLLAVGFPYQLIIIMLTVQLPLGGQHAFMDRYITPPCVGSRSGAALLTKWGETAIIKAERALLLVVGFAVLHHIIMNNADRLAGTQAASLSESCTSKFYADRLAATERSVRFYGQVYKPPASLPGLGRRRGFCFWGQVVWWAGSSR